MKITFYGQNSLGIEVAGTHLLVDPFIMRESFIQRFD